MQLYGRHIVSLMLIRPCPWKSAGSLVLSLQFKIIDCWFDDKTLDQVIEKSRALGQDEIPHGYVLTGEAVLRLGLNQNVTFDQLLPMLKKFLVENPREDSDGSEDKDAKESKSPFSSKTTVSLYQNTEANAFRLKPEEQCPMAELETRWKGGIHNLQGCGSLNTTFDYGSFTGDHTELPDCDMLHCFYRDMNELTEEEVWMLLS